MHKRYDRNIMMFGQAGQKTLGQIETVVVGVGGLGTHVVQQLAYLGVGQITLIDPETFDTTNLNRYIGGRPYDVGKPKVDIGKRTIKDINPDIEVRTVFGNLLNINAYDCVKKADYVFGCLDCEGARLVLNELCLAYNRPYFDLASEVFPGLPFRYGGRVCFVSNFGGCLYCLGELDLSEARLALAELSQNEDLKAIYGVDVKLLGESGPSVVSLNGVVASLAITEFMVESTNLRMANPLIKYYGNQGIVTINNDKGKADCYYCVKIRGKGDAADVDRYIKWNSSDLI